MPLNEKVAQEQWTRFQYCKSKGHEEFISKADKCDQFFIGNQWLAQDLTALELARRPALTINKILSTVSTILGQQIYNRTEVLFRPANGAPPDVAEALTKVWMQISQNNQLPWRRSDVFCDGIVRSRGFYDVRMDYNDSMSGEIRINQVNSKNVVIDPDAEEYDPDCWNDVYVTKWLTTQDIATLYSEDDAEILKQRGPTSRYGYDSMERVRDTFGGQSFLGGQGHAPFGAFDISTFRNVRILDRQHRKLDKQLHFVDVSTGDMRPVPEEWDRNRIASFLEKTGGQISTTKKLVKRIRWTVTADDIVLHDDWSPYKHFTVVPYFPNFRYGKTVGVVENLLSPQEILNKVSSQELHIVNTTANSGWVVEENSLVNMTMEELETKGASTGLVIEHRKGSLPPQKITPNQPPSGLDRISMKAEENIKTISGVSDSMQGFDRADVAAKAIAYKQQSGSIGMSKVLDNLERTDWILARNVLDLVQEFYTSERVINITHDDFTNEAEQLTINQQDPVTGAITNDLTIGEYDIVITSSPYRSSLEDSQFEQAKALREIGVQIPDAVLIENSRLLRRADILKQMQGDKESPEAQAAMQLQQRAAEAEVAGKEATAQKTQSDAQLQQVRAAKEQQDMQQQNGQQMTPEMMKMQQEAEMEQRRMEAELSFEERKQSADMELARFKIEQEIALKKWEAEQEMALKREIAQMDMTIKREQAEQQAATQQVAALKAASTTKQE
jgi:hypothetical protein